MLTTVEKLLFGIFALVTIYFTLRAVLRIIRTISRGAGQVDWSLVPKRLIGVVTKTGLLTPVWRARFFPSLFHALVAWGFFFYVLVNLGDLLEAYIPEFRFLGTGALGNGYRLLGDLLSVAVLLGMALLLLRRFLQRPEALTARESTLLHPKARKGIQRDSLIVGLFIFFHVGARFIGESFQLTREGPDPWQPLASGLASLWSGMSAGALVVAEHAGFWVALGLILLFFPYFLYSKHLHLFMAPINFLLNPERRSPGELEPLDFEDESIEQFGAERLEDLAWHQILDAYACIMCNRCQEACPAYTTGKVLSPAALEINKRYFLNQEGERLEKGEASSQRLLDFAITEEAVFACTACGACTDICPVGNDPMRDILDIRRALVLMENKFPEQWGTAFRGMERAVNPWNLPPAERMKWAEGLDVPRVEGKEQVDLLWWVGCAPATDARAQKTARAFAQILKEAGVDYAVLGEGEGCTGDSARRAGNEYLFYELAKANVEMLNEVKPKRIVTTCPHCLHTLKNEYPAFGGHYQVLHHSQLIAELVANGQLALEAGEMERLTYHDPCYLGRQNGVLHEPREVLEDVGSELVEMADSGQKSFCCGAGGGQMWKEEEAGEERVSARRVKQAVETGAETLALGCPFCMVMLEDAAKEAGAELQLLDLAEIVAEKLKG